MGQAGSVTEIARYSCTLVCLTVNRTKECFRCVRSSVPSNARQSSKSTHGHGLLAANVAFFRDGAGEVESWSGKL
jgi:hypothetical protein